LIHVATKPLLQAVFRQKMPQTARRCWALLRARHQPNQLFANRVCKIHAGFLA
jgi:hypothetical protein